MPILPERGFLPQPDPLTHLALGELSAESADILETLIGTMPAALATDPTAFQAQLAELPHFDFEGIHDLPTLERLFMLYAYFANASVYGVPDHPHPHLPRSIAMPFQQVACKLHRPPIFSYATLVLNNWQRLDPTKPIELGNLEALVSFRNLPDEQWFGLVHVQVEANAAPAMLSLPAAIHAAQTQDTARLQGALETIGGGIGSMLAAFHRMTEGCDPDIYHRQVRVYMFGFNNVVYEGLYDGQPQTLTGGSGAQSSTIPALVAALGIQHEQTGLMQHLEGMKQHMPLAHRHFIAEVTTSAVRDYVLAHRQQTALVEAYNYCIKQLMVFRRAHLHYAKIYIFNKVENPVGTGGTLFMDWLTQLMQETEAHLIH